MPAFFFGTYTSTIVLNNPGTQNPATVGTSGFINVNSTASSVAGILGTAGFPWTITNNGTVQSVGNSGIGIDLRAGGTITNAPAPSFGTAGPGPLVGGTITGSGEGIDISGGAGSISNSGTIQQIGAAGSNGVYLRAGGTITNTGSITAQATFSNGVQLGGPGRIINGVSGSGAGLISGYITGVYLRGGAAGSVINNYGTIQSTKATYSVGLFGEAVQLRAQATLNNFGTITAGQTKGSFGVLAFNGGAITNNSGGLIQASGIGVEVTGTATAALTNAGTVRAVGTTGNSDGILTVPGGSTVTNSGTVFVGAFGGGANGISLNGGGVVNNSGLINAAYGSNEAGVIGLSAAGATVINTGTILAAGTTTGTGVNISAGSVNNSGLISGTTVGVAINAGTIGTVSNSGTIAATTTSLISNTVILTGGLVQNSGVISNSGPPTGSFAVHFGNAPGTVVNQAGALITAYNIAIITGTAGGPSTVTNYGTIRGTGFSYPAIQLRDGGTVTNRISGLITGSNGVQLLNASGTVSNSGTISGTAGTGLNLANGGSVNNSGLITASATGVFVSGAGETVVNSGSIIATSAVILNIGGSIGNSGLISSGAGGVTVNNAVGTLTNTGTITGTGDAVRLNAGGSVTNGVSGSSAGLIRGATGGVYAFLNPSTVTNFGTIQQTGSFADDAVYLAAGGTVTNAGLISAGFDGIDIRGPGTVTNSGVIQGGGSGNFAGLFLSGSSFLVSNTGTITSTAPGVIISGSGTVNNSAGAVITGSNFGVDVSGTGTVANSGTITGITTAGTTFGDGVAVNGINGSIANSGLITRVVSGATGTINGAGVFLDGGTLTNTGTISDPTANNGNGVQLGSGGGVNISNRGLITAYHDGIGSFNTGTITLNNYGTVLSTQRGPAAVTGFNGFAINAGTFTPGLINNFGLIASSQTAGGGAIVLNGSGTVINHAGATIDGAGGNAITSPTATVTGVIVSGLLVTVVNSGTIINSSTRNALVYLGAGGSVTNNAGGLISATSASSAINSQAGGIVTNSGTILSALSNGVFVRGGAGTITNFGTIAHTGIGTTGEAIYLGAGGAITNYGLVSGSWPGAPVPVGYPGAIEVKNQTITLTNLGTVTNPNSSNGINLLPGGTIINGSPSATAATISAVRNGIYLGGKLNVPYPNAPGFITNYGSIISTGRNAIAMVSGGTITNRGLISGYRNGVSLTSAAGTIANFGTIAHAGGGTSGDAVYLNAGGVVTNYGLISGAPTGSSGTFGYPGAVDAHNQPITVTNLGTITNPNNSNGVNLLQGGTIINGSPSTTSALIFAPHGGVYMGGRLGTPYPGAVGYVTNYGAIINTGSAAPAIKMVSGGSVTNHGAIASGRSGISFDNTAGTVDNFGAIASSAATSFTAGAGVYLQNGGQITNEAGGSITALRSAVLLGGTAPSTAGAIVTNSGILTGNVGIQIGTGDLGNNTIVNFGTIIGTGGTAIDLANDGAQVVLEPGSSLQGTIANFHAGDSIDFAGASGFSLTYVNGVLTLFNQTTPVGLVSVSTPYVNPQFSEVPDGSGGTTVTVTPPGGPVLFDFIYRYNGSSDYYYGKVADDGTFGYQVGQQIATAAGNYMIFNEEPGAVGAAAGSVFVSYISHAGQGATTTTPLKFAGGQPDGTNGLGSESDAVIGSDGQPHAFSSAAPPSFPLDQLFGFIFSYADGSTFYTGTVADDGSFGYGAIADGSGTKQIFDSSGTFQGYYTIYREGPTSGPGGKVTINRYFSGQAGQSFDVDQSVSGGSNGLGSETGVITVNGARVTFGDPPEAVLPATNPAFVLPGIDTSDPATAATQIYQHILGRTPDSSGLALYAGALANGASAADVQSAIAHSTEAQNDLNLAYQQVLGRDADGGGLATYENALASGTTLSSVRLMLSQSPEAQNDLNQLYRQVLGRDADNGGLGTYTSVIVNGGSLQDVRSTLAHSGEAQNDLQMIYQQLLGRDADGGGLASYQDALGSGWGLDGVRANILHSAEAQSDLARLFNSALGRDPNAAELAGAESRLAQGASLQGLQDDLSGSGSAGGFTAIAAGNGDTTLSADAGPTAFLFNDVSFGNDTVFGFNANQDAIVLNRAQAPDFSTLISRASQGASGTLIATGSNQSILLNGVPLSGLHPSNFEFV